MHVQNHSQKRIEKTLSVFILQRKQPTVINQAPSDNLAVKKVYDEELDEWFNEVEFVDNTNEKDEK